MSVVESCICTKLYSNTVMNQLTSLEILLQLKGSRSLAGQTIEAAGLRGLPGLFLIALERGDGTVVHAVGSEAVLAINDTLWFAGERSAVSTLRRIPGIY